MNTFANETFFEMLHFATFALVKNHHVNLLICGSMGTAKKCLNTAIFYGWWKILKSNKGFRGCLMYVQRSLILQLKLWLHFLLHDFNRSFCGIGHKSHLPCNTYISKNSHTWGLKYIKYTLLRGVLFLKCLWKT